MYYVMAVMADKKITDQKMCLIANRHRSESATEEDHYSEVSVYPMKGKSVPRNLR